jgi:hypothetical protein
MNKHDFLALSNVEILWEVIGEQDIFQNRNVFETVLTEFYETENMKHGDLVMLNKAFISSILFASQQPQQPQQQQQPHQQQQQKIPITFEELQTEKLSQFEIKLTEKEEDFKQSMARPLPQQIPNFRDKMDEPLTEIETLIKRTIAERNYDVSQIVNANANANVNELKSEETSIKKEKLSPLFFSSLNQQKNTSDTPEIKYIKIDNSTFRETPVPIDLNQPTVRSSSNKPSKHISWNKDIQNSDGILFDQKMPPPPLSRPNRIEQMQKIHDDALDVFRRKNADYGDSFATYGIIGILIRIEDKMRRAISISKNGVALVKDESFRDTLLDLHNYAAMGLMLLEE